jgi:hypothetical protein
MGGTEGIVDVHVSQACKRLGERVVIFLFFSMEA